MKRFVFCMFFAFVAALAAGCAFADEPAIEGEMKIIKADKSGNPLDFVTKDGLHIIYMGTFRCVEASQPPEGQDQGKSIVGEKPSNDILSVFMVMADKDTSLWINTEGGVDTKTNNFSYRGDWGHIAGRGGNDRPILEEIWVRVEFFHVLPIDKFGELPRIGRIPFLFNGTKGGDETTRTEIIYKKLRVLPPSALKELEPKLIAMEEGEDEDEEPEALEGSKPEQPQRPAAPEPPKNSLPDGIEAVG